jgi:hypothetical protein
VDGSLLFVGGRLRLRAVIFVLWLVIVAGQSWAVVGVGRHVLVVGALGWGRGG